MQAMASHLSDLGPELGSGFTICTKRWHRIEVALADTPGSEAFLPGRCCWLVEPFMLSAARGPLSIFRPNHPYR
jgi:hypothetical protein